MRQYHDLLRKILTEGRKKESARTNMPPTLGISRGDILMNLDDGFPLLTTKEMYWKGIVHELLWFLKGDTNIKYLVDNNVNIWNGDAYRWYCQTCNGTDAIKPASDGLLRVIPIQYPTIESFVEAIKSSDTKKYIVDGYYLGDLGKVYGYQWRNQNGVDQINDVINSLKNDPFSRYHIIDGWNKADFPEMALPPCHLLYQFIVRPLDDQDRVDFLNKNFLMYDQAPWTLDMVRNDKNVNETYNIPRFFLDLNMYQRSCDTFLGVPFNLTSMSLLLMIMAKVTNMLPGIAWWIGGDVHLYLDHIPLAKKQLERTPHHLPEMIIKKTLNTIEDIMSLTIDDFELLNYSPDKRIKGELFTGNITKNT